VASRGSVPARDATAAVVLEYLDTDFVSFARGVADARYTFWLGSGISLDRVEGLKPILLRALRTLQGAANPGDPECRFRIGLNQILGLSGLADARLASLDQFSDPETWPTDELRDLLNGLANSYSKVLDVRIKDEDPDYLLWEVIDVRASYAMDSLEPDCEHLAVTVLALEGHVPQIATANWDGLIEKAFAILGHRSTGDLQVCVRPDDLDAPAPKSRMIKFHGCAIRASIDENTYRPLLIHQAHQIVNYHNNSDYRAIRTELVSQATTRPTLMIGLSAQDVDIQAIFGDAASARTWPYPSDPPAYVFGADALGADQGTILRSVYGESFNNEPIEIEANSVIRAYAKPLLTALVLSVLCQKLEALAKRCASHSMAPADLVEVSGDIRVIRDLGAQISGDYLDGVLKIAELVSNAMHFFRAGSAPTAGSDGYWPLTSIPLYAIEADAEIPLGGLPELAVALGVIGRGAADGAWSIETGSKACAFQLTTTATDVQTRVFFAASARATIGLEESGAIDSSDNDVLVVHSDRVLPSLPRSPRAAPGRTGRSGPRHLGMSELLMDVASAHELRLRFREEGGL
jgi:hypothetical protein